MLFWLYVVLLFRLTVFRPGCLAPPFFAGNVVWIPFVYLGELLDAGNLSYFCYLFFGNIFWFVPLGAYLGYRCLSFPLSSALGCVISLSIETGQYLLSSGVSEVEDVILNTLGVMLGWALMRIAKHFAEKQ